MLLYKSTERIGLDGNTWCVLSMAPASLTDFLWLFSVPSSKWCSGTSDRPWPLPSTSIPVHYRPVSRWWTQLNGYSLVILCTVCCDNGRLLSGKFWLQAVHHSNRDFKCVPCADEKCIFCWMMLCCREFTPSALTQNLTGTACSPLWGRSKHGATTFSNTWQQTMRLPTYCQNGSDMLFVGQEPAQNCQAGCKALEE